MMYPSNSTEYYYDQLGQLTNITERAGDAASSTWVASAPLQRNRNRYFAFVNKLSPENGGTGTGVLLCAMGILLGLRRLRIAGAFSVSVSACQRSSFLGIRVHPGNPWLKVRLFFRSLFPSFFSVKSGRPEFRDNSCPSLVKSHFWRHVTYLLIVCLLGSDPKWDFLWTARAACDGPLTPNSSTDTVRVTSFKYDFDGHLTQVDSPEGYINYGYELATGRHTSTCTTNSYVGYDYDELGRLKTVTVSRRNRAQLGTNEVTRYTYTAVGNRESVTLPNGIVTTYLYDGLNRLTNLTHKLGTNLLASYTYQLHQTGRRTNAVEILKIPDSEGGGYLTNTLNWSYDQMYRLTYEDSVSTGPSNTGTFTDIYQYDQVGNRFAKIHSQNGLTTTITNVFNENDQLLKEVTLSNGVPVSTNWYAYDSNGSVIAKTNVSASSSTVLYGYDLKNKLSNVTTNGSGSTNFFVYNDQGIRVRSSVSGGSATHYLIDANNHTGYQQILEELSAPGSTPSRSYVLGDDVLGQCGSGSAAPQWLLYDGHGSTRQLSSSTGASSSRYNYDAYGVTLATSTSGAPATDLLYCGEQYDSTLGMYNLRARFYDPDEGRFWTIDTFGGYHEDPLSLHSYLYCNGDSVNNLDASGHEGLAIELLLAGNLAISIRSSWEANRVKIYGSAIAAAIAVAAYYAGSWAASEESQISLARSAIRAVGKTLEGLIGDARQIMGLARNSPVKVVPIPRCVIKDVANHVASAQSLGYPGFPMPLTRCNPQQSVANRTAALAGLGSAYPNSWDEYPFASSWQGGSWTSIAPVPLWQNLVQGGIIAACYSVENITYAPPTPYFVVVTP